LDRLNSTNKKGKSGRGGRGGKAGRPGRRSHDESQQRSSSSLTLDQSLQQQQRSRYACALCTTQGGALKRTDDGQWAHVVCALWIPKARVGDVTIMEPIQGIDEATRGARRLGITCSVCRRDHGGYVQCSGDNGTCRHHFHPLCGWYAGCYMNVSSSTSNGDCRFYLYCPMHTPDRALVAIDPNVANAAPLVTISLSSSSIMPPSSNEGSLSWSQSGSSGSFSFESRDGRLVTCPYIDTFTHTNPTIERMIRYRLELQRDLRNRGRQEQTRKMKRKRRRKRQEERKLRAGRARALREDRYETDRCAVCFKTDDEVRLFNQLETEAQQSSSSLSTSMSSSLSSTGITPSSSLTATSSALLAEASNAVNAAATTAMDWQSGFGATTTGVGVPATPSASYPMSTLLPSNSGNITPLSSPTNSVVSNGSVRGNRMIRCDRCEMDVHQQCYGVSDHELDRIAQARASARQHNHQLYGDDANNLADDRSDDDDDGTRSGWLCSRCHSNDKDVSCVLCPRRGGAFKRTSNGRWAHVACAQWIPEITFGDTTLMEHIDGVNDVSKARRNLRCYLCKRAGPCIQCSDQCSTAFHPLCGLFSGQYMSMHEDKLSGSTTFTACCRRHTPLHLARGIDIPPAYSTLIKLRRHLDKARTLIDLVKRREKLKQRQSSASWDVLEYQWATAKPSSGRYAHQFSRQFQSSLAGDHSDGDLMYQQHALAGGFHQSHAAMQHQLQSQHGVAMGTHGSHSMLMTSTHPGMITDPATAAYYGYMMPSNVGAGYAPMSMTSTAPVAPAPLAVRSRGGRKKSQSGGVATPLSSSLSSQQLQLQQSSSQQQSTLSTAPTLIDFTTSKLYATNNMNNVAPSSSPPIPISIPMGSPQSSPLSSGSQPASASRKSGRDRRPSLAVRDTLADGNLNVCILFSSSIFSLHLIIFLCC
jgi:hypothetical protein